ncbi:hypothetical protein KCP71_03005 [Salmonella enterica subsp. enterica]|nr:hypothetical protein KCP71_03005 [Salmonella enterica subsp. enterica]
MNPGMAALAQGQFSRRPTVARVLFIESVDGSDFHDVFPAQIRPKGNARPSWQGRFRHLYLLCDGSRVFKQSGTQL